MVGDRVTLREKSVDGKGKYAWALPTTDKFECISLVGAESDDYFREATFKAETAECRFYLTRALATGSTAGTNATNATVATQTFEFVVYPTRKPPVIGELIDVDTIRQTEFTFKTGHKATVRASEFHHRGFQWAEPDFTGFTCGRMINANFGDFKTGYRQYLVEAGDKPCEGTFKMMRPAWWKDQPKEIVIKIKIEASGPAPPAPVEKTVSETVTFMEV
jgi:hypothetical protein